MGELFGPYEIERRLGAGGMAEVFLARRRGPEGFTKRVALKRVLPGLESDSDFVRLFQDEARLAAHLDHPHVAALHDFGAIDGQWFMAMEYVEGVDLRRLLNAMRRAGERLPMDVVLLIAADLATALLYAHELDVDGACARIVHRDVTPSNVLLGVGGSVKLTDFGIARAQTHEHRTQTGIVKGKVAYMPPEQALGRAIDHRVDLFALGVILYECASGRRPYSGETELETFQLVCRGDAKPLSEVADDVPPALETLVRHLLAPHVEHRADSASDVLEALCATPPSTTARLTLGRLVAWAREATTPRASEPRATESIAKDEPVVAPEATRDVSAVEIAGAAPAPDFDADPTLVESSSIIRALHENLRARPSAPPSVATLVEAPSFVRARRAHIAIASASGAALALCIALVAVLLVGSARSRAAVIAAPAIVTARVAADAPRAVPIPPAKAEEPSAPPVPPAPLAPGRLTVIARPMGEVSIDGRAHGFAPVTAELAPGEHEVRVRILGHAARRQVSLDSGERRRIVVRLPVRDPSRVKSR